MTCSKEKEEPTWKLKTSAQKYYDTIIIDNRKMFHGTVIGENDEELTEAGGGLIMETSAKKNFGS